MMKQGTCHCYRHVSVHGGVCFRQPVPFIVDVKGHLLPQLGSRASTGAEALAGHAAALPLICNPRVEPSGMIAGSPGGNGLHPMCSADFYESRATPAASARFLPDRSSYRPGTRRRQPDRTAPCEFIRPVTAGNRTPGWATRRLALSEWPQNLRPSRHEPSIFAMGKQGFYRQQNERQPMRAGQ